MNNYIDMIGQVWGRLTVLRRDGSNVKGEAMVICRCSCGREVRVRARHLRTGNTTRCRFCKAAESHTEKIGRVIGSWRVEGYAGRDKHGNQLYLCRCTDCRIEKIIHWGNLTRNKISCNCSLLKRHKENLEAQLLNAVVGEGKVSGEYMSVWKIRCIGCGREYTRAYQRNIRIKCSCPEHSLSSINNEVSYNPKNSREANLKKFGLSIEEYDSMAADQDEVCAICGNPPKERRLSVDHDHITGKVRGLLCRKCNLRLAFIEDSSFVLSALEYLSDHQSKPDWLDSLVDR